MQNAQAILDRKLESTSTYRNVLRAERSNALMKSGNDVKIALDTDMCGALSTLLRPRHIKLTT